MYTIYPNKFVRQKRALYKTLLIMKLTILLMISAIIQVSAGAKAQKVTLSENYTRLDKVFDKIREQTGYDFLFSNAILKAAKPVTIQVKDAELEKVLSSILETQSLKYTIKEKTVIVSREETLPGYGEYPAFRQALLPGRIAGKVTDERGEPLPGANIRILETSQTTRSAVDGSYNFSIEPGTYTIEVTYVSFQTKRITQVVVRSAEPTSLNIVLNAITSKLSQVTVTASYRQENTVALYAKQKNAAGLTNGISREQMAALPDKNIGETLKRISGISTNDNRRVVVRGIAERYNLAMMDGATLPSTDVQVRDFEFDIVPSNLIDNVVVNKTSTPDMSFGFGGGLVQINTMAVPENNFTTFSFGSKYVKGSTGKDFLGYGRGKYDYLGFDDGSRDHFPKNLNTFANGQYDPSKPYATPPAGVTAITPAMIAEQNKRIGGLERIGERLYTAAPGQNYQFSLGRSYQAGSHRLGFAGSLSYRNEQATDDIAQFGRGEWEKLGNVTYNTGTGEELMPTAARQYNFNTTWGALLNMGWNSKNHKLTSRNFYSRVFSNQFSRIHGYTADPREYAEIREYDRPKFIDLLQNRINGEHSFGAFRFDWNVARNKLTNTEQDAVEAWLKPAAEGSTQYVITPSSPTNPGGGTFNRSQYKYIETNKIAEGALSYQFELLQQKQTVKSGYQYLQREGIYDWTILPISTLGGVYAGVPVQEWSQFLDFKYPLTDLFYYPAGFSENGYKGKNINQAVYGMLDNRFSSWLRLVWGLRAEYYKYERIRNGANDRITNDLIERSEKEVFVDPETGKIVSAFADAENEEKTWRYLPSASLTATPLKDLNIRAAYAQSVVRPALIENSRMMRFDPVVGGYRRNEGVLSTRIDHYDLRLEWYPSAGEVISAGYFHKYFDKPAEIYRTQTDPTGRVYLLTQNSEWAKVDGWEFDVRKSLGFINPDWGFMDDIFVSGNLTLQTSEVQASTFTSKGMNSDKYGKTYSYRTKVQQKEKRPLYGQVPKVYNIGLQYNGSRLGGNVAFNHMGYKTFVTGLSPEIVEYERPRNQLDAQLSYRFLKNKKLQTRLNISNILNDPYRFYVNSIDTYELQDQWKGMGINQINEAGAFDWGDIYKWKEGFSRDYEEGHYETSADGKTRTRVGDKDTFIRRTGTSFSLSLSYNF
ncbi:outer membrane receptor protein involved in Fe transport [Arcticibacter tournemirensis]|nr:outer membrane receptor protein involved in Fe transport [Arcticibacter tournemirensis]